MLIVKNQTVIDCFELSDTKTHDDENDVIFIFWVNRPILNT